MKQLAFDFVTPPRPTLDNFIVGRNAEVLERLRTVAANPGGERFVYLWAPPASGRTHLLRGTLAALEPRGSRVTYLETDEDLLGADAAAIDAAAVDDVDRLGGSAQIALFNLYNALREKGGTLIAAGNKPPSGLTLRADVVTRLAWGLVYEVHALSDAEKAQALAEHATSLDFALQPDAIRYLLTHTRRDMRTLIATVEALDRYSLEAKRPVTLALLRELLAFQRQ
ncbi:MAG TPA: DnaA regulatory inactivator Hda [Burkholderiales bacterium]|nr:DnaA regulatory inactivator Hda [Burkholderiales bacterium]